jgi:hypothetical protein
LDHPANKNGIFCIPKMHAAEIVINSSNRFFILFIKNLFLKMKDGIPKNLQGVPLESRLKVITRHFGVLFYCAQSGKFSMPPCRAEGGVFYGIEMGRFLQIQGVGHSENNHHSHTNNPTNPTTIQSAHSFLRVSRIPLMEKYRIHGSHSC